MEGTFRCDGVCGSAGSVWGSGPYTSDSCVCRAARHAGVIGADGGVFTVRKGPVHPSFEGSERNDVLTGDYGADARSIMITR